MSRAGGGPSSAVERVRLFVALELPGQIRSELIAWRERAVRAERGLRPLGAESLHVTLCFLGWQDPAETDAIAAACGTLAAKPAPLLSVAEPRWLPPRRPRVLAVELLDPTGALTRSQATLSEVLAAAGWYQPEKRPYLPHVTVARVGGGGRGPREALPAPRATEFDASRATLFRSRLLRSGARYEPLATIELQGER